MTTEALTPITAKSESKYESWTGVHLSAEKRKVSCVDQVPLVASINADCACTYHAHRCRQQDRK